MFNKLFRVLFKKNHLIFKLAFFFHSIISAVLSARELHQRKVAASVEARKYYPPTKPLLMETEI